MATQLFNAHGCIFAEAMDVERLIGDGYSFTDPTAEVVEVEPTEETKESNNPVRDAAKEAGIEGWDTKRIKTLEAELSV